MGWLTATIILLFGLMVVAANFGVGPLADENLLIKAKISADWLIAIRGQRSFIFSMGAMLVLCGLASFWGVFKQQATALVSGAVVAFLLVTVLYQNYFGEWLNGSVGRDAEAVCAFAAEHNFQGKKVYLMTGLMHPFRYNLRYCDKELHVADALKILPTLPGGFYLIGTMSRDGVSERKPGSLEASGAWGEKAVRSGGEIVFSTGNSPLHAQRVCVIYFK